MSLGDEELPATLPRWEIPSDWQWVSIADVGKVITGNTPPTKNEFNYGNFIPFVKPPALTDKGIRSTPEGLSETGVQSSRTLPAGAVLVSCIGGLGKTGIAKVPVAFNQQINAIVFDQRVIPEFGFYYSQTLKPWLHGAASATTLPIVNKGKFQRAPFPLAPLGQQKRIVAEIEKQFSRLDEAVANLKRVKANLKRYKAAVLKAAVEGKLTEAWRKQHPDTEPASQLLQRILAERRAKWEQAELAKMQAKSKAPKDDTWKKKYPEPAAPDTTDPPELPEGWRWAKTDQLFWFVTSGSRGWAEYYSDEGAQFLRIGNLDHDSISIDFSDLQRVNPPNGAEGTRTRVEPGDILVSITADVGMIAIAPCDIGESFINQHISLARPVSSINGSFLAWHLCAKNGQDQFKELQRGATKAGLGLEDIRAVNLGLPPLEEQKFIVDEIERHFTLANVAEAQVDMNLKRAYRLRQSVLALSFSGKMFIRGLVNGG